jgi:hypothetical protein
VKFLYTNTVIGMTTINRPEVVPIKRRADERTRTADLSSLRVRCAHWPSNPLYATLILDPSILNRD